MKPETVTALCEVASILGVDEITVIGARDGGAPPSASRLADGNGNVLLPVEERKALCRDCERGEEVLLLDACGVVVGISAGPGEWSHAYDLSWWRCPGVRASDANL